MLYIGQSDLGFGILLSQLLMYWDYKAWCILASFCLNASAIQLVDSTGVNLVTIEGQLCLPLSTFYKKLHFSLVRDIKIIKRALTVFTLLGDCNKVP